MVNNFEHIIYMSSNFNTNNQEFIVTVEGGLGAQIISLSVYYFLKKLNYKVLLDLSYFDNKEFTAQEGDGKLSIWKWELEHYGIKIKSLDWIKIHKLKKYMSGNLRDKNNAITILNFNNSLKKYKSALNEDFSSFHINKTNNLNNINFDICNFFSANPILISDGKTKIKLFTEAMQDELIKKNFIYNDSNCLQVIKKENINFDNTCSVHLRRGDFVNVANEMVSYEEIINICKKLPKKIKNILVFSDSSIEKNLDLYNMLSSLFKKVSWLNNVNSIVTHQLMRISSTLICSNSQFSISAAYLSDNTSLIPNKNNTRYFLPLNNKYSPEVFTLLNT